MKNKHADRKLKPDRNKFQSNLQSHYIFKRRGEQTYNLRKHSQFCRPKVNSVYNGTESVSFLGPVIWDLVPNELKDIGNLAAFKKAIKKWSPEKCPCRLCKVYINNVGFI